MALFSFYRKLRESVSEYHILTYDNKPYYARETNYLQEDLYDDEGNFFGRWLLSDSGELLIMDQNKLPDALPQIPLLTLMFLPSLRSPMESAEIYA